MLCCNVWRFWYLQQELFETDFLKMSYFANFDNAIVWYILFHAEDLANSGSAVPSCVDPIHPLLRGQGEEQEEYTTRFSRARVSMPVCFSYSPWEAGWVWKIHCHTHPTSQGEYEKYMAILTLALRASMTVYISYSP